MSQSILTSLVVWKFTHFGGKRKPLKPSPHLRGKMLHIQQQRCSKLCTKLLAVQVQSDSRDLGSCSGHFSQGLGLTLSQAAAEGTDTSVRKPCKGSSPARHTQERKYWHFCISVSSAKTLEQRHLNPPFVVCWALDSQQSRVPEGQGWYLQCQVPSAQG